MVLSLNLCSLSTFRSILFEIHLNSFDWYKLRFNTPLNDDIRLQLKDNSLSCVINWNPVNSVFPSAKIWLNSNCCAVHKMSVSISNSIRVFIVVSNQKEWILFSSHTHTHTKRYYVFQWWIQSNQVMPMNKQLIKIGEKSHLPHVITNKQTKSMKKNRRIASCIIKFT